MLSKTIYISINQLEGYMAIKKYVWLKNICFEDTDKNGMAWLLVLGNPS